MGFSPNGPTTEIDNTYTWSDTLSWTKGTHTFKGGLWFTPYQNNTVYDYYVNGDFYFYGSGGSSYLNNDKAAFLFGLPDEFLQFGQAPSDRKNTVYDYYVNGDFYFYGSGGSSYLNNDKAAFLFGLPDEFLQFGQAPSN